MPLPASVLQQRLDDLNSRKAWWEAQADSLEAKGHTLIAIERRIARTQTALDEVNAANP